MDFINPFTDDTIPQEIYWSIFPSGDTLYKFRFIDITKAPVKNNKNFKYLVIKAKPIEDYPNVDIIKNTNLLLHMPLNCLTNSLKRFNKNKRTFDKKEEVDLVIHLKRRSKKAIDIYFLDAVDMSIYDEVGKKKQRNVDLYTASQ